MKKFVALLGFALFSVPVLAGQISDEDIQNILAAEDTLSGFCRGWSGDLPETQEACKARDKLLIVLDHLDWCHGKKNEYGYQMKWHKCTKDSYDR